MARTYSETVEMFGVSHEFTADSLGPRKYGAVYVVAVDGDEVARLTWQGGRRYRVTGLDARVGGWQYITGDDGGRVADAARYVAVVAVHDRRDAAERAKADA